MPLPSFTSAPQWLETPAVFPLVQFINWGVPGPYSFGGKLFWVLVEITSGSATELVAYSNSSPTGAQPSTRIAPGSPIQCVGVTGASVFYPGSGSLIYVAYIDTSISSSHGVIQMVTFDMTAGGSWGTPSSTGITVNSGTSIASLGTLTVFKLANGNIQIVFDAVVSAGTSGQIYTAIFNGSSWTGPTQLTSGGSSLWTIISAAAISLNKIGVWYYDFNVAANILYSVINGGSLASTATVTTFNHLQSNQPITAIYDAVSDTAACLVIQNHTEFVNLLLASPSASTTVSVLTVYDDTLSAFDYDTGALAGNATGNQFYILLWDSVDNLLHIFGSTALASGWTTSPATFYSQAAHPPVSPSPTGPEIFPNYATFLNGTLYSVTSGFLAAVSGGPIFCGVMTAMIPVVQSQTLQLNKVVNGGSLPPSDWTLTAIGSDSPATILSGPGPQVGPSSVPAELFQLSEALGPAWSGLPGPWGGDATPWNGGYTAGNWVCTGGGSMPTPSSVIVPVGATIVCTITNTFPNPPVPPQPGTPCQAASIGPPTPATDTQFELRRVYASMKPHPRIPVRGGTG